MKRTVTLIIPEHAPRNIVAIEHDLCANSARRTSLIADSIGRDLAEAESREWLRLFRERDALQHEFCAVLHRITGLTCSRVSNALDTAL